MDPIRFASVSPTDSGAAYCLEHYFTELAERFDTGFDPALSEAPTLDEFAPPGGAFLLAYLGNEPVGCGGFKRLSTDTAYLKRMWVDRDCRGHGLGLKLLDALERQAANLGYRKICLETHRSLAEAQNLYRRCGYIEVAPFNDEHYADHWFEKALSR